MSSTRDALADQEANRPVLGPAGGARELLGKALRQDLWRLQRPELGAVLEELDQIRRDTERVTVKLTAEAGSPSMSRWRRSIECARPDADSDAYADKQHQARSLTERAVGGDMAEF